VSDDALSAGDVFRASLDAVVIMDAQGLVRDWNPAAERTFGHTRAEALGREVAELIIPGPLRHAHRNGLRRHVETGDAAMLDRRLELSALRQDGSEFPIELKITRLSGTDEPMFVGFLRELADRGFSRRENVGLQKRMAFLAQVGLMLDSSLDYGQTLRSLADMTVPELAQLTIIDLVDGDGSIAPAVAASIDPAYARALEEVRRSHPLDMSGPHPVAGVLRTGESALLPEMGHAFLRQVASGEEHLNLIEQLGYHSAIVVPLVARQHVIGTLSLLRMRDAESFAEDDLVLAEELARRAAIVVDNARLYESSRRLAGTLQASLLPRRLPDIIGVTMAARYRPALEGQEVGGDFYDAFQIEENRWAIAIGDVCGKGAEAAALTALGRYTIRALAEHDATVVLERLNEAVIRDRDVTERRFLTVLLANLTVQPDRLELEIAAAGHPPPLILRADGSVEPVAVAGTLLGVASQVSFESQQVSLHPGDAILLYTDGLTDARAPGRFMSDAELAELLARGHGLNVEQLAEFIEDGATSGAAPRDDIAILVVQFAGVPASRRRSAGVPGRHTTDEVANALEASRLQQAGRDR
jgi:PAS domain S-box-containing protein